ncbi:hypothetical protein [Rhodococcus qingshengii]|uniref:hypothetical protein n=1 Tax=Rhodococcus qingshengii TaxID=334542 RepID=UPI00287FACA1|nr:hypothetical protein [Rhodococcus qingshengii]
MKRTPVNTWLDDKGPVTSPPPWSDPAARKKLQFTGAALLAVVLLVAVVVGITTMLGGGDNNVTAAGANPQTPSTIATSSSNSLLNCQEIRSPESSESSGRGDTESADGVIIAYEYAFFVARDARAMVDLSVPSPTVATEDQLATSINAMPVDTPWCVNITPATDPDKFDVAVRFVEADGTTVTTWNQTMTVLKSAEGQWNIIAVQGR